MDSEHEPFLSPNTELKDHRVARACHKGSRYLGLFPKAWAKPAIVHLGLVFLYAAITLTIVLSYGVRIPRLPSAIDNLNIKYSPYLFQNLSNSPYGGPPAPESDAAWDALLAPMHIRVSGAELQHDNQESVALTEGGGFLGWMGVFHELHCIRLLQKWHYRTYYYPNATAEDGKHLESHVDHCFEMLRQAAVCHADSSLTTFKWDARKTRPMFNASESMHTCVDWDALMGSIKDRVVGETEIKGLKNPLTQTER